MKFPNPPSYFTGSAFQYLSMIAAVIQNQPNVSFFTQQTPNGNVLGVNGDWAIYNGSTSTVSHIWVNQSAATQSATSTGWALVGTNIVATPAPINTFQAGSASTSVLTTTTFVKITAPDSGGDLIVTLPTVASYGTGRLLYVKQQRTVSDATVYVVPSGGNIIGAPYTSNYTLGLTNAVVGIMSGTTMWDVVSQGSN